MTENRIGDGLAGRIKENKILTNAEIDYILTALVDVHQYRNIGTVKECRTAVERMKPKKPTDIVMAKDRKICVGRIGECPCCGSIVAEDNFTCEDCFQVLDWSE